MVYKKESTILQIANFIGESDKRAVDEIEDKIFRNNETYQKKMFGSGAHFRSGERET